MDDQRFDDLSRRLATGTSRRRVLRALAGGVLGGVAGALGVGRAAAACATDRDCPPGERCDATTATCIPRGNGRPAARAQSQSVSVAATCGVDADCPPNEACVEGVCTPRGGSCTRGSACSSDATCCGGEVCDTSSGVCVGAGGPCTNTTGECTDSLDCCGNEECIGGTCQQVAGGCAPGAICAADAECCGGQVCANGTCVRAARPAGCPDGQVRCSGACVDIASDESNCGGCGTTCGEGLTCVEGECTGMILCEVDTDCPDCQLCIRPKPGVPLRCVTCEGWGAPCLVCGEDGRCRQLCPGCNECELDGEGGATCRGECPPCSTCDEDAGLCVYTCNGCESCQDDGTGTFACVESCAEGLTCVDGACTGGAGCDPGLTLCGDTCAWLGGDPNHCGACGTACESGICVNGTCSSTETCEDGRFVCPDEYLASNVCCDSCSECAFGPNGWACETTCTGPTGAPSACAPCLDGVCGADPCDYSSETCNQATGQCEPFPSRICPDGTTVCPPNHVCGSNHDGTQTICCPADASGSANVCVVTYDDGTTAVGCQCTTEFGQEGCLTADGVCCQSFSEPGVCYCAPSGFGCSTDHPACADPDNCSYCCSGICVMDEVLVTEGLCA